MENWWSHFFINGWDAVQTDARPEAITQKEIAMIDGIAKAHGCKKILDAPCGEGRITLELAKKGYLMEGIDFNPAAIRKAIQKKEKHNIIAKFKQEDMLAMEYENEFDMLLCWYSSFGYFGDADNEKFVAAAAKALKKGACFLLDLHPLDSFLPRFSPHAIHRFKEVIVLEERTFDHENSRVNTTWTFQKDGHFKSHKSSIRLYSYAELSQLLKKHGFSEIKGFGSYDGEIFQFKKAKRLIMKAVKQ